MEQTALCWNPAITPPALHPLLGCLAEEYPISSGAGKAEIALVPAGSPGILKVVRDGGRTTIEYGSIAAAARGLGHALAGQETNSETTFQTLGIMLDCSRNAVMTVPYLKRWMRRLALMGYNMLMLYTEDTYQLPGEPYFGYMRGGYTGEEIREIDAYAKRLGIEVVACIQTLGHLAQILKWPRFKEVADTERVLLVDEEQTYELIGKMIRFWAEHLTSRRIHLGMDEAHDLGRGRFLEKNGWQPPFEVFNRHLARVESICSLQGLKSMIWSDMYFRMGSANNDYYDKASIIPDSVKEKVPKSVDLVYWDYYSTDEDFYREWIRRHRELGSEPIMASGIWTWSRFWYDHAKTEAAVKPCVSACRKAGIPEIIFTIWGDGTSYCEFDSAFAGLAYSADLCYGGTGSRADLAPFVRAVCASDYSAMLLGTGLQCVGAKGVPTLSASTVIWDDPLLGIGWQGFLQADANFWPDIATRLRDLRDRVAPLRGSQGTPDYGYLWALCDLMVRKIEFRADLVEAYHSKNLGSLKRLKDEEIPRILAAHAELQTSFRRQWLRRNKPFGMESTQIRLGGGAARYQEAAVRIGEFCEGQIPAIEELDAQPEGLGTNPVEYFVWLSTGSVSI